MNYWLEHCEPPRPRPAGVDWDVFVSYRSLDRSWAIALYDMLAQCGYKVFLDQFVLVAGQGLATQLGDNLKASNSGVLLWSERSADSKWVKNELNAMIARRTNSEDGPHPFHFLVAALDRKEPPGLAGGTLYIDFSDYPDGPTGIDIVRLTCGLQGKPLNPPAVARLVAYEKGVKEEPAKLRAMAKAERYAAILERIKSDDIAYTTSATIPALAVDQLIRGKRYEAALEALQVGLTRFPNSLRLRQLRGLALRRSGKLEDASYELNLLVEEGHEDPETLGMLGAVYADLWEAKLKDNDATGARDALEKSRGLYVQAFRKVPSDTYVGINAASKSALLGELATARTIAADVTARLEEARAARGGAPATDYWDRVTEAEALLVAGKAVEAFGLYHDARVAFQNEKGSIQSTGTQVARLLAVLDVPAEIRGKLKAEFALGG
jgi:hypothetical protein